MAGSVEGIRALVEPSLATAGDGFELWDVEVTADTVRVLVDREGGIDLEALSRLDAKVISPLLDAHPELTPTGSYSLEVSSPGLERTLRRPEHYARYIGREVSVKTKIPVEGSRRWQGVLRQAGDQGVVVEPAEGPAVVSIAHDQIERARAVLVWGPAEKPGKQQKQVAKRPATDGLSGAGQSVAFTERTPE